MLKTIALKPIALRALRAFVAGAVGNLAIVLAANNLNVKSLADLETLGYMVLGASVIGGLMALDKLYRWKDLDTGATSVEEK